MKKTALKIFLGLCTATALFTGSSAFAQMSFTGAYDETFSEMGTGTTTPAGWSSVSEAGTHYTFVPAVANEYAPDGTQNPNLTAGALTTEPIVAATPTQGSSTGKGLGGINWVNTLATSQNGEGSESLGTDPSGNAATILELNMTNNTGSAITAVNLSYDIDRFTTISNTNGIPTGYTNTGVEELPGYQLFYSLTPSVASSWVNVASLNPTANMGTTGAVQVPNTVGITVVPTTTISLDGTWTEGGTLAFAWLDDNGESPSPDQEIGLNNVDISAAAVPEPSSIGLGLIAACVAAVLVARRRIA